MTVENLKMAYGGQDVLTGASAELPKRARAGVVGPNGGGKSTLMRLIAGLDQPTGGRITRQRDARIVYVAQEPEVDPVASVYGDALHVFGELRALERQVTEAASALSSAAGAAVRSAHETYDRLHHEFEARGGYTYEAAVRRALTGLGLPEPFWGRRAAGLSGGERARLALAKALLRDPDVLLLDEPTNHLDLDALDWLEDFLISWPGTLMAVSHDRYFLDRVVDRIWEVRDGKVDTYPGTYSHFARQREERDRRQQEMYERQQEEIAKTEEFIRRYRNSQKSRQARGRQKLLNRLERVESVKRRATVHLAIDAGLRSGQTVLRLNRVVVEHPGRRGEPLFVAPQMVEVERGYRVAIVGPNGAGKTTLLRTLAGEVAPLSGRVEEGDGVEMAFFRQAAENLDPDQDVIMSFLEDRNRPLAESRDILARFLFRGEEIYKRVGDLSGGERSRLALARVFGNGSNLLLLDEPTNHLDLPSREALESVLPSYPGAILFVSHDRRFIDTVATHIWSVEDGRLTTLPGNWTEYQALRTKAAERAQAEAAAARVAEATERTLMRGSSRPATKDERRQAARVRDLEREVSDAEAALTNLQTELEAAVADQHVDRIRGLGQAVVDAEARLNELISAWEDAAVEAGA
ncbi:MAG: ABC-F family ATP-binding cassette domain-containing protein [Chloroflexi bacterium]|nr:ABC-F family ATP-binding cassette domain-containing protein [Chloroflexota bacterium]